MVDPVEDPRQQSDGQPSEPPISGLAVVVRTAVIFLIIPLLVALAARYLF